MKSERLPKLIFLALLFVVVLVLTLTSGLLKWGSRESVPQIPGQKAQKSDPGLTAPDPKARQIQAEKFENLKVKFGKLSPWIPPTVAGKYHHYMGTGEDYYIVDLPDISDIADGEERFFVYWKTGSNEGNKNGTLKRTGKKLLFSDLGEGYLVMDGGTPYLVFEDKILRKHPKK